MLILHNTSSQGCFWSPHTFCHWRIHLLLFQVASLSVESRQEDDSSGTVPKSTVQISVYPSTSNRTLMHLILWDGRHIKTAVLFIYSITNHQGVSLITSVFVDILKYCISINSPLNGVGKHEGQYFTFKTSTETFVTYTADFIYMHFVWFYAALSLKNPTSSTIACMVFAQKTGCLQLLITSAMFALLGKTSRSGFSFFFLVSC